MENLKIESLIRSLTTPAVVSVPVSTSQTVSHDGLFALGGTGPFPEDGSQFFASFIPLADASPNSATLQADNAHPLKDHSEQERFSDAFDVLPVDAISQVLSGDDFLAEAIELLDRPSTPEPLPKTFERDVLELIDVPVASLDAAESALSVPNIRQDMGAPGFQASQVTDLIDTSNRVLEDIENVLPQTGIIGDLLGKDGLLGDIIGPGGLVDDLIGSDGILNDLLGDDGLLSDLLGTGLLGLSSDQDELLGEPSGSQSNNSSIVDFVLSDNMIVGSLVGSDGLLGNLLNDIIPG